MFSPTSLAISPHFAGHFAPLSRPAGLERPGGAGFPHGAGEAWQGRYGRGGQGTTDRNGDRPSAMVRWPIVGGRWQGRSVGVK